MITRKQLAALRHIIFNANSKQVPDLAKRIAAHLLAMSDGLEKQVCISLVAGREGYSSEEIEAAARGFDYMVSSNGTTHLHSIMYATGTYRVFCVHYGEYVRRGSKNALDNDGQFVGHHPQRVGRPGLVKAGLPDRYTFWLAKTFYSRQATLLKVNQEILNRINLLRPGLYPDLEAQLARQSLS